MRENDHSCHIGKYGIGMRRKVLYGFFVCAATLGIVGLTVSAEKNIAVDGSHNALFAMQELTGQVAFGTDNSKHSLLAMQALEQEEIAAWRPSEKGNETAPELSVGNGKQLNEMAAGASSGQKGEKPEADMSGRREDREDEYADLAIAHVADYVNVRKAPNTESEIVGKIYNGAVAQILETAGEQDEWFHVTSGSVQGYIKAEYFIYGDAAADVVDGYVTRYVVVQADRLNVRESPDVSAKRIGYLDQGEKALLVEEAEKAVSKSAEKAGGKADGEWVQIAYGDDKRGYVASEFVKITEEFLYAKSIEEEKAEQEAQRARQQRKETSEEKAPEITAVAAPNTSYSFDSELRSQIVDYAMQFLGNKYVSGGNSLTSGTDCSGFTSLIYADFGYSISRTPAGQLSSAGRSIDYESAQPGDIICYGSGKCTHVGLYIGNGQIIHEANSRKGVVIYNADYDNILGVKNVID